MRAAIYARKSTDDNDKNPEHKSVRRQVDNSRAFAEARGWTVDPEHVFVDDGISGAEFKNRPGLLRMLNRLRDFDVVVMSELSRLGRDQLQTQQALANIANAKVEIWFYLSEEKLRFDSAVDRFIVSAASFAAELEREKASQRSRDALLRKAQRGYNTGGVCYGYDNRPVFVSNGGERVKSHTDYAINEAEAEVVRRIFRMYADGHGVGKIARTMNGDARHGKLSDRYFGRRRPAAPRKGTGSWAPASVRAILLNERYRGKVPFGEFRNVYVDGTKKREKRPERLLAERPDLRIVAEELWSEVAARFAAARKTYFRDPTPDKPNGRLIGRPGMGTEAKYLLTGLGQCGCCGANMHAAVGASGSPGKRRPLRYYACGFHKNRGSAVCANDLRARMEDADRAVLGAIEASVLTPAAIDHVIDRAVALVQERRALRPEEAGRLETALRRDRRALENFLRLIGEGTAPAAVLGEIRRLEADIAAAEAELAGLAVEPLGDFELRVLRRRAHAIVGRFKDAMLGEVPLARQALRKLLSGPLRFVPENGRYLIQGKTVAAPVFASLDLASPRGFEPLFAP